MHFITINMFLFARNVKHTPMVIQIHCWGFIKMKPSLIKMLEYQILYTIFFYNQIPLSAYKNAFILQIYNGTFYLMAH